jgi:hypothetical protein
MENIQEVVNTPVPTPRKPPIKFNNLPKALESNTALIASFDYDFEALLAENQEISIGYNSEFRPISQLRMILGDHPNFEFFETVAGEGMDYKSTSDIPEADRKAEVDRMLRRGNHKLAMERPLETQALFSKHVNLVFAVSLIIQVFMVHNHAWTENF